MLLAAMAASAFVPSTGGSALAAHDQTVGLSTRVGGVPLELVSARGSLWVLTCERRCAGEARRSAGRVVRVVAETGSLVKAKQPLIEVEPL